MTFTIARTVSEALEAMAAGARPIGGGTDLVVGARQGKASLPPRLVAVDRIEALRTIEAVTDGLRIGAAATHARLMANPAIVTNYTALADAAALIGSPATRNTGTLGGNVMNGSPAMDTGAPLLVLGGSAELHSASGVRTVPVEHLWTGPGETAADPDELCVAVLLPGPPGGSAYVRLEYRRAMEIAVVGAAAVVTTADDGSVAAGRVALAAVAPTIIEVAGASEAMAGRSPDDAAAAVAALASDASRPISDLRGSDRYRRHIAGVMARRAVEAAARRAAGETVAVPVNRSVGIGAS